MLLTMSCSWLLQHCQRQLDEQTNLLLCLIKPSFPADIHVILKLECNWTFSSFRLFYTMIEIGGSSINPRTVQVHHLLCTHNPPSCWRCFLALVPHCQWLLCHCLTLHAYTLLSLRSNFSYFSYYLNFVLAIGRIYFPERVHTNSAWRDLQASIRFIHQEELLWKHASFKALAFIISTAHRLNRLDRYNGKTKTETVQSKSNSVNVQYVFLVKLVEAHSNR